jgi:hypothetical protein
MHTNENAYKAAPARKNTTFRVVVMLDMVPGAWHEPEDFVRFAFNNHYVQNAEIVKHGNKSEFEYDHSAKMRMHNAHTYSNNYADHVEFKFEVQPDSFPGTWHKPEEFLTYFTNHSYALFAEYF